MNPFPRPRAILILSAISLLSYPAFALDRPPDGFDRAGDRLFEGTERINPLPDDASVAEAYWKINPGEGTSSSSNLSFFDSWLNNERPDPTTGNSIMHFRGSSRLSPVNDFADFTQFQSIFFDSGAGAFTLTGNRMKIYGQIANNSTSLQTISLTELLLVGGTGSTVNQLNANSGDLTITSPITLDNNSKINVNSTGGKILTLSGVIQNGASSAGSLSVNGNTTVVLSNTNTFTGGIDLNAGVVSVSAASNLGGGSGTAVRFNGGTLRATTGFTTTRGMTVGASGGTVETNSGTQTLLSGPVTGGTLTKTGTGRVGLRGSADNASLGFTVNQGILALEKTSSSGVHAIGSTLTVNSGGTVLLGATGTGGDQIFNGAGLTLNGGTFNTGGLSEGSASSTGAGIGALTLTANSTIDFGSGTSILHFASVGAHTPTTGPDLSILNWSGSLSGGGTDQFLFTGTASQFTSQYDQSDVIFSGFGVGYNVVQFTGFYEVTPVPEPSTWAGAALAAAVIGQQLFARKKSRRVPQS